MSPTANPTLRYVAVPKGVPTPEVFRYETDATIDLDAELNGGFITKLTCVSSDPYLRGRMRDPSIQSYSPAFALNEPIGSFAVAEVVKSETEEYKVGDHVYGILPTQVYVIHPAPKESGPDGFIGRSSLRVIKNEEGLPWTAYVGAAGMPGKTAFMAWKEIAEAKKGEVAYVSSGAGPVGQLVIQIAKQDGLKVIASAGSKEKVDFCKSLGADVVFNYKEDDENEVLKKDGPVDVNWVNVGGKAFEIELQHMATHGRLVFCGWISGYNGESYGVKNLFQFVAKRLKGQGFIVGDFEDKWSDEFYATIPKQLASGELKFKEHIYNGLEKFPQAFIDMLNGDAHGKVTVTV